MSFLFLGLLRHKLKETADFLLVEGLTHIIALHLVLIATLRELDLNRHGLCVVVIEARDIEVACFLDRSGREICLVSIVHLGGYVGNDTSVDTRITRVRVDVPADYGLLSISTT